MIDTRINEGLRLIAYTDTTGHKTIGYGHNLETPQSLVNCLKVGLNHTSLMNGYKITEKEAEALFQLDMKQAIKDAKELVPALDSMPRVVALILADMVFNLGKAGLAKFTNTLRAINKRNWKEASSNLKKSLWYRQVKNRAVNICKILDKL